MRYFYILFALLLTLPAARAQPTGSLAGRVTDARTGDPLPGANVYLDGSSVGMTTGNDGRFRLDGVPAGPATLVAQFVGYATQRRAVEVAAGRIAEADFALSEGAVGLGEVTVKGEGFRPGDVATTANLVSEDEIRRFVGDNPLRLIEQVPGMDLGAYRQGGTADVFSIRGFGGGGHGGDVAVQIDGIPLNEADGHADGYADLNVLVPLELQRLVVYKGPSSALYGNFARGGTLALDTRRGGRYRDASLSGGAYQTLDAQLALGQPIALGAGAPLETNLAAQFYTTDGYSANSGHVKGTAAGRLSLALSDRTDVNLALRGHAGDWSAPGYIPQAQFLDDATRDDQGPNANDDGGSKTFFAERVGLNHSFSPALRLVTFGYAVQQRFTRFAKFGYEAGGQNESFNEREVYGGGASLNGLGRVGGAALNYVVGAELYSEGTVVRRWSTTDRVRAAKTQDRDFLIRSASAFVQAELALAPYFRPTVALRYDDFSGRYANADPGAAPFTNDLNSFRHLSPKLGVRSTVAAGLDLRASASNGYALPDEAAKYDPALDVEPVEIWQYETGVTYAPDARVTFDVAAYLLDTSSEVLEVPLGSGLFGNFGQTRRRGVEAEVSVRALAGLEAKAALGLLDTEVRQHSDAALVGTGVTGLPSRTYTLSLDYTAPAGFGGRLHVHGIGPYALTSDGSEEYGGYTVANVTGFYDLGARFARRGRLFAEVTNVLDERYAEAVFAGFGTLNYAPAPPRRLTVGLQVGL